MSSANYSSGGEEVKMGSGAGAPGQLRANAALASGGSRNPTAGHGGEAGLGGRLLLLPGSARRGRDSLRAPSRQRRLPAPGATGEGSGASPDGAGQVWLLRAGALPRVSLPPSSFSSSSSSCCCRVASRRGVPPPARGVCGLRGKAGEVAGAELRAAKA